jgi:hypothetical protein
MQANAELENAKPALIVSLICLDIKKLNCMVLGS